jgi:hypothetical protein
MAAVAARPASKPALALGALPGGDLDGVGQHVGSVVVGIREDALDDLDDQDAIGCLHPARQLDGLEIRVSRELGGDIVGRALMPPGVRWKGLGQ